MHSLPQGLRKPVCLGAEQVGVHLRIVTTAAIFTLFLVLHVRLFFAVFDPNGPLSMMANTFVTVSPSLGIYRGLDVENTHLNR